MMMVRLWKGTHFRGLTEERQIRERGMESWGRLGMFQRRCYSHHQAQ